MISFTLWRLLWRTVLSFAAMILLSGALVSHCDVVAEDTNRRLIAVEHAPNTTTTNIHWVPEIAAMMFDVNTTTTQRRKTAFVVVEQTRTRSTQHSGLDATQNAVDIVVMASTVDIVGSSMREVFRCPSCVPSFGDDRGGSIYSTSKVWLLPGSCNLNGQRFDGSATTSSSTVATNEGCFILMDVTARTRISISVAAVVMAHATIVGRKELRFIVQHKKTTHIVHTASAHTDYFAQHNPTLQFDFPSGRLFAVGGGGGESCSHLHVLSNAIASSNWESIGTASSYPQVPATSSFCSGVSCSLQQESVVGEATLQCVGGFHLSTGLALAQHWQLTVVDPSLSPTAHTWCTATLCVRWTDISHLVQGSLGSASPGSVGGGTMVVVAQQHLLYMKGRPSAFSLENHANTKVSWFNQASGTLSSWIDVTSSVVAQQPTPCSVSAAMTTASLVCDTATALVDTTIGSPTTTFVPFLDNRGGVFLTIVGSVSTVSPTLVTETFSSRLSVADLSAARALMALSAFECTSISTANVPCSPVTISNGGGSGGTLSVEQTMATRLPSLHSRSSKMVPSTHYLAFPTSANDVVTLFQLYSTTCSSAEDQGQAELESTPSPSVNASDSTMNGTTGNTNSSETASPAATATAAPPPSSPTCTLTKTTALNVFAVELASQPDGLEVRATMVSAVSSNVRPWTYTIHMNEQPPPPSRFSVLPLPGSSFVLLRGGWYNSLHHCQVPRAASATSLQCVELQFASANAVTSDSVGGCSTSRWNQPSFVVNGSIFGVFGCSSPSQDQRVGVVQKISVDGIPNNAAGHPTKQLLFLCSNTTDMTATTTTQSTRNGVQRSQYTADGFYVLQYGPRHLVAFDVFTQYAQSIDISTLAPYVYALRLDTSPLLQQQSAQSGGGTTTVTTVTTANYIIQHHPQTGKVSIFVPRVNLTQSLVVELIQCYSFNFPPQQARGSGGTAATTLRVLQPAALDHLVIWLLDSPHSVTLQPAELTANKTGNPAKAWHEQCIALVKGSLSSYDVTAFVNIAENTLVEASTSLLSSGVVNVLGADTRVEDTAADTPMGPLWILPDWFTAATIAGCVVLIILAMTLASVHRACWRRTTFNRVGKRTEDWVDVFLHVSGDGVTMTPEECEGALELMLGQRFHDYRHLRGVQELFFSFDRRGLGFLELSEFLALAEYVRAVLNAPPEVEPFPPRKSPSGISVLDGFHLSHISLIFIGMPLRYTKTALGSMITLVTIAATVWFVGLNLFERYGDVEMKGERQAYTPRYYYHGGEMVTSATTATATDSSSVSKNDNINVQYGEVHATISISPRLPSQTESVVCVDIETKSLATGCTMQCANTPGADTTSEIRITCPNVTAPLSGPLATTTAHSYSDILRFHSDDGVGGTSSASVFDMQLVSLKAVHAGVHTIVVQIESRTSGDTTWQRRRRKLEVHPDHKSERRLVFCSSTATLIPSVQYPWYGSVWPLEADYGYKVHTDIQDVDLTTTPPSSRSRSGTTNGVIVPPTRIRARYLEGSGSYHSMDLEFSIQLQLNTQVMVLYRPTSFGRVTFASLILSIASGCALIGGWLLTVLEYILKKRHGPKKRRTFHYIRQMAWNDRDAQDDGLAADCAPPTPTNNIEEEFMLMMARPPTSSFKQLLDGQQRYDYSTHGESFRESIQETMHVKSAGVTSGGYYKAKWDGSEDKIEIINRDGTHDKNFTWVGESAGKKQGEEDN